MRRLRDSGNVVGSLRQPLWEFLQDWLQHTKRGEVTHRSLQNYTRQLQYVIDAMGDLQVGQVRPAHVRRMLATLQERGLAATTIHGCHALLRAALDQSVQDEILDRNPVTPVKAPRLDRVVRDAPTLEAFETLLDLAEGTQWYAAFTLLGGGGMRVGELLALHWVDVAGDAAVIHHSVCKGPDGVLMLGPTKTRHNRDVPLSPGAVAALTAHRSLQRQQRIRTKGWQDRGLVFPARHGGLMYRASVNKALDRYLGRAELAHFRVHDLRHMCATLLLEDGMAPHAVAEQLGHSGTQTTMARYAHVTAKQRREGAERMGQILRERG